MGFTYYNKNIGLTNQNGSNPFSKTYFSSHASHNNSKDPKHSRSKSKSNISKDKLTKEEMRIIKDNIKYPQNTKTKSTNNIKEPYKKEITIKIYERIIDKLFSFMKSKLSKETYLEIKEKFINEVNREISSSYRSTVSFDSKYIEEPSSFSSSITKLIRSTVITSIGNNIINQDDNQKKKLKLSCEINDITYYDISPRQNNNNKKHNNSFINQSINHNYIKSVINNISKSKKHSLYTLTKNKILHSKNNSLIKEKKSKKENCNVNRSFIGNNNNQKFYKRTIDLKKKEYIKGKYEIIHYKRINNNNNFTKNLPYNQRSSIHSKNSNSNNRNTGNKKFILKNGNNNIYKYTQSYKMLPLPKYEEEQEKKLKNSDQLRVIKSSLDDNLKVMFNFSYEGFLNKESESESKKSFEEGYNMINVNYNKNIEQTNIYKTKYQY